MSGRAEPVRPGLDERLALRAALFSVARHVASEGAETGLAEALTHVTDWPALLAEASDERLLPLLADVTAGERRLFPDDAYEECRRRAVGVCMEAAARCRQLVLLDDGLRAAGVQHVHLRGPALSQYLWANPLLRQSNDLDLMVLPEQLGKAREVAAAAGFVDRDPFPVQARGWSDLLEAEQEFNLRHPRTGLVVEFHWRQGPRFAEESVTAPEILQRAVRLPFLGRSIAFPAPRDVVLLHVLHATTHGWSRIEDVAVMTVTLQRLDATEARQLLRLADEHHCRRRLNVGVLLAVAYGTEGIDRQLRAQAANDARARKLAADVGALLVCVSPRERAAVHGQARNVLWQARALDGDTAMLSHLWRRLTTPGQRDWATGAQRPRDSSTGRPGAIESALLQWRRQRRIWARSEGWVPAGGQQPGGRVDRAHAAGDAGRRPFHCSIGSVLSRHSPRRP